VLTLKIRLGRGQHSQRNGSLRIVLARLLEPLPRFARCLGQRIN
jgi:hypothetical protein